MLAAFASLVLSDVWPNMGIHDGDNKVVWTVGCCDGDLITVDFRDEVGDGNGGNGLLKIYNKTSGLTSSYYLGPFYGTWKAFGPYCAPQCPSENPNCHNLTFTSDANAHETTVTVTDSFGLIKGMGGMEDFPIAFSTIAPAKFCMAGQSEFDMARAQPLSPAEVHAQARQEGLELQRYPLSKSGYRGVAVMLVLSQFSFTMASNVLIALSVERVLDGAGSPRCRLCSGECPPLETSAPS